MEAKAGTSSIRRHPEVTDSRAPASENLFDPAFPREPQDLPIDTGSFLVGGSANLSLLLTRRRAITESRHLRINSTAC